MESDTSDSVVEDDVAISMQYVVNDLRVDRSTVSVTPYIDSSMFDWDFIPISDKTPSYDQFMSGFLTMKVSYNGEVFGNTVTFESLFAESENLEITDEYLLCDQLFVLYANNSFLSLEPGTYLFVSSVDDSVKNSDFFVSITIPNYDWYGGDLMVGTLKNLVVSIFGEYTPVNTTALLTETVDNVTTTTLIDVVAAGAAGVDWEWCAGVFLFGIMLFCLFKLLGGILS